MDMDYNFRLRLTFFVVLLLLCDVAVVVYEEEGRCGTLTVRC